MKPRYLIALLAGILLLYPLHAGAYTEIFYFCKGGNGTVPESNVCATAYDIADSRTAANWDVDDEDDGKMGPNDRIILLDDGGTYASDIEYFLVMSDGLSGKPITIEGESRTTVIIDANGVSDHPFRVDGRDYITVKNITIANADRRGFLGGDNNGAGDGARAGADNLVLENITITGSDEDGAWIAYSNNVTITNCDFNGNGDSASGNQDGVELDEVSGTIIVQDSQFRNQNGESGSYGLDLNSSQASYTATITRCLFENNILQDLSLKAATNAHTANVNNNIFKVANAEAIETYDASTLTANIYNNTIYGASSVTQFVRFGPYAAATSNTINFKNNIISGPCTQAIRFDATDGTFNFDYNNYNISDETNFAIQEDSTTITWANWVAVAGYDTHGIGDASAPLFLDATNGDFHLKTESSPCYNAGTPVGLSSDYDGHLIYGNPEIGAFEYILDYSGRRMMGSGVDIGAYEWMRHRGASEGGMHLR